MQRHGRPEVGIGTVFADDEKAICVAQQRLDHRDDVLAVAVVAVGLVRPAVRLVMVRAAVGGAPAVGAEPDDRAARPDEMRRQIGRRRQRGRLLHQRIRFARKSRRVGLAQTSTLRCATMREVVTTRPAKFSTAAQVLRLAPPALVAEVQIVRERHRMDAGVDHDHAPPAQCLQIVLEHRCAAGNDEDSLLVAMPAAPSRRWS